MKLIQNDLIYLYKHIEIINPLFQKIDEKRKELTTTFKKSKLKERKAIFEKECAYSVLIENVEPTSKSGDLAIKSLRKGIRILNSCENAFTIKLLTEMHLILMQGQRKS